MFNREPTTIINGLAGLLSQVLPLLVILGLIVLDSEKLAALISVINLVLTFVSTTLIRSQVVPMEKADAQIKQAVSMPTGTTVGQVIAATEANNR